MGQLVSVIIPVYNVENYLMKCLDSCFSQTYVNIEVVAVNDGSTDDSGNILDEYAAKELRLKVIHQHNKGVVHARECGIVNSQGSYICFVDSDDFIEKEMIDSLLQKSLDDECDIVSCDSFICDEKTGNRSRTSNYYIGFQKEEAITSLLLRYCTWSLWGKLFRRELFDSIKMPYDLRIGEDGLVCFQVYNNSRKIGAIDQAFYNYVQRASSVTHDKNDALSLDIIEFIKQTTNLKELYDWSSQIDTPMNTFVASQVFVYYVNGGSLRILVKSIEIPFGVHQILRYDLRVIEKMGLFLFFKANSVSGYLRKLYIYATQR